MASVQRPFSFGSVRRAAGRLSVTSLQSILGCSRFCEATRPEDKAYGLLGLFGHPPPIEAAVRRPLSEIYSSFTKTIVEKTRSVWILHTKVQRLRRAISHRGVQIFEIDAVDVHHENVVKIVSSEFLSRYQAHGGGVLDQSSIKSLENNLQNSSFWKVTQDEQRIASIRHEIELACYGRRIIVTTNGMMGLAAPRTRVGDKIIWLYGGRFPFIVRQRGDGNWALNGDCCVPEFRAYPLIEDISVPVQYFTFT